LKLKLGIGQRILLGYGLAILFMASIGIATYRSTQYAVEANDWVLHTFLVIGDAEDIRADLLQLVSAGRGYVATGEESFLKSIEGLQGPLADSRKLIKTLTLDNPDQQRRLAVMDPLIASRVADLIRITTIRKEKGPPAAIAAMQANELGRMAEILSLLAVMENEERRLLSEREQTAQFDVHRTNRMILYGSLVGVVLTAFIAMATRVSITRRVGEIQRYMTSVGAGDLAQKSVRESDDELGTLAKGLNRVVSRLTSMATETRIVTENLNSAAVDFLASAREQSALNGEQVAAYQETSATMQQVSKSCSQMSDRAKEITVTAEAVSIANTTGLDAVQKTNQTVEAIHEQAEAVAQNIVSLSEKTQAVGDILSTVNDIAEQSHLLALNAAIEAAAAGEHGRSFAVVAGEIKNLAGQSKAATVQVKTILGDIQKEINTSVMLTEEAVKRVDLGKHQADQAASAIRNMAANIDQSVQAFQQIVAGTNQQQIGFENVMQAMKDLSRGSEQAATTNRQAEKAAINLADLSKQLGAATEGYRL
jgi:methyl-accepting chemotaxis protein